MRGFRKRRGRGSALEGALRANRPQPRADFLHLLTARIYDNRPRVLALRLAVAGALTLTIAAALLAFGGIGYAGAAVQQVEKFAQSLNPASQQGDDPDPSAEDEGESDDEATTQSGGRGGPGHDQYQEERRQCRRAEQQRHLAALRDIRRDFQECKREENRRHNAAMRACGNDRDCKRAENDRHRAELARCREEFRRRMDEERERHRAALRACQQIGR